MSAITLQESRTKLVPGVVVMSCAAALFTPIVLIALFSEFRSYGITWPVEDTISLLVFASLIALADIHAFNLYRAIVRPTRLDVTMSDLSITSWRSRASFSWADLGLPIRKGGHNGRSSVYWIEIPRLHEENAKPLRIEGQRFREPFDVVLSSLTKPRMGAHAPSPTIEDVRSETISPIATEPAEGKKLASRRRRAIATLFMPAIIAFKVFKLGKFGGTAITMILSLGIYTLRFGWRYAAGFIGLLFLHEMGHYLAAQRRGLNVGVPTFIPFVGAWIELKERPVNVETEAYVGLAGPLVGALAAAASYLLARELGSQLLLAVAYAGFFLNFFNLIPISSLDGGRITSVLSPRIWFLGVPNAFRSRMFS